MTMHARAHAAKRGSARRQAIPRHSALQEAPATPRPKRKDRYDCEVPTPVQLQSVLLLSDLGDSEAAAEETIVQCAPLARFQERKKEFQASELPSVRPSL